MLQYQGFIEAQSALGAARSWPVDADGAETDVSAELDRVLGEAGEVERSLVLSARRRGEVSPEVADEVLADIESRSLRDLG